MFNDMLPIYRIYYNPVTKCYHIADILTNETLKSCKTRSFAVAFAQNCENIANTIVQKLISNQA